MLCISSTRAWLVAKSGLTPVLESTDKDVGSAHTGQKMVASEAIVETHEAHMVCPQARSLGRVLKKLPLQRGQVVPSRCWWESDDAMYSIPDDRLLGEP
eukprot:NODE_2413_length_703_cov_5.666667_g1964_i0.p3 GENE.NODE_2413_length_703_cov_5.666667_g1964_i0~~NODE_2413_length_703_cov_5.666667_g1964_i0.p3  ORF type:complete len:99 (+),score=9.40 NODE_2413_length_703_cov_5.666667_g1964_i0:266-562(+)